MKKNVMMRLASFLLVAVLISTSAISGTYAKYVTHDTATDTARVAKWGVTVEATDTAFGHFYYNKANENGIHTTYEASTDSVASGNGEKVVAPGTKGNMTAIKLSGIPEVDVEVTYKANLTLAGWEYVGVAKYCPIKITVNDNVYQIAVGTDASELEVAVENAINEYTKKYPAGTDLSSVGTDALRVSWEWPFESGHDDADTALGNQAADGSAATIALEVICTVTQVD